MENKLRYLTTISGLGLLMLFAGQAQAYVCSGIASNDFRDPSCSEADVASDYGLTEFDLLAKDNTTNELPDGVADVIDGGTLIITKVFQGYTNDGNDDTETVRFTYTGITPNVITEKYDGVYSVYDWTTQVTSEGGGVYSFVRVAIADMVSYDGTSISNQCKSNGGSANCSAGTSHVSAYGSKSVVPIPAAVWLFGSAMVGMTGIGYRRRRTA